MKKRIAGLLKVIIPLGLGVFLIWYFLQTLSPQDKTDIVASFKEANYSWILFSLVFAVLSHVSRAYRWSYTLKPLGYKPKFLNNFFAVMIGYLVNLAIPRLGELTRCGVMARYEKIPFEKLLGTVIAERIADLVILIIFSVTIIFIQIEVIGGMVKELLEVVESKLSLTLIIALLAAMLIGVVALFILFFNKSFQHPILVKIREFVYGLFVGIKSIWTMKDKWAFLAHTVFIWVMYVFMFYLCFFSLAATSDVPFGGVLTAFVMGGFAVVFTNGGLGAYPIMIYSVLLLYGIDKNTGAAFGWIVWTAQTLLLLALGALSFVLMPVYNKKLALKQAV
ncbi:MAG: TIGR00374 family protein [Crocinitomicaceae bacterium]|nr:TIGR00374 family protein [Crocinitomicaceae bacterium]